MASLWIEFALCCGVIGLAGTRLIRFGDALATLTGLSRSWVGFVLVATVTSLPELVTGISSAVWAGSADLALGDALGSCLFNLLLLGMAQALRRGSSIFDLPAASHAAAARYGIVLMLVLSIGILALDRSPVGAIGHVGVTSVLIVVGYALAMRRLHRMSLADAEAGAIAPGTMAMRRAVIGYFAAAALTVAAGVWLPIVGVQIALQMGWSHSFVGTLFMAMATSLPELATVLAATRLGLIDMVFGNVLGSNLFDLLIVALDDIAYLPGPLLSAASRSHLTSLAIGIGMYGVVLASLRWPRAPTARLAAPLLLGLWLLNLALQRWF